MGFSTKCIDFEITKGQLFEVLLEEPVEVTTQGGDKVTLLHLKNHQTFRNNDGTKTHKYEAIVELNGTGALAIGSFVPTNDSSYSGHFDVTIEMGNMSE